MKSSKLCLSISSYCKNKSIKFSASHEDNKCKPVSAIKAPRNFRSNLK